MPTRRLCAFLTMEDLGAFRGFVYDHLAVPALRDLGWDVEMVPWTAEEEWRRFDRVVIRSTWDYQADVERFLGVLETIEAAGVPLDNPLAMVRENVDKGYLLSLQERGVPVVPTRPVRSPDAETLAGAASSFGVISAIVKPRVGASAHDTFVLRRGMSEEALAGIATTFAGRDALLQPFVEEVGTRGERSAIVLGGRVSHVLAKRPKAGDFRSQEDYGAEVRVVEDEAYAAWSLDVLEHAGVLERTGAAEGVGTAEGTGTADRTGVADLLYARVDALPGPDSGWLLGELELIEPSLYFTKDPASPARFARALDRRHRRERGTAACGE